MINKKRDHTGDSDAEDGDSPAKKARIGVPTFAFAWGNEKFSDARVKIFEDSEDLGVASRAQTRSSSRLRSNKGGSLDEDDNECEVLHVCKLALASYSAYFQRMFDVGMVESNRSLVEIRVKAGCVAACKDTIRYVYTGEFEDSAHEHLLKVVLLADRFDLPHVAQAACRSLRHSVCLPEVKDSNGEYDDEVRDEQKDILRGKIYEKLLSMPEPVRTASWFQPTLKEIRLVLHERHWSMHRLWSEGETRLLGGRSLAIVLSNEDLEVESEQDALFIALSWLEEHSDDACRPDHEELTPVLDAIRFPAMSVRYLRLVARHCSFAPDVDLTSRVEAALDYHSQSDEQKGLSLSALLPEKADTFNSRASCEESISCCLVTMAAETKYLHNGVQLQVVLKSQSPHCARCELHVEMPGGFTPQSRMVYGTLDWRGTWEGGNIPVDVFKQFISIEVKWKERKEVVAMVDFRVPTKYDPSQFTLKANLCL